MAGKKNADKVVRKVNKGNKAEQKIKAIHNMVESLIKGESDDAAEHLHDYLQMKTREIVLGESDEEKEMVADEQADDEDDDEDMDDEDADEEGDDEDDDEESDDEIEEGFAQPSEGNMSKKVVPQTKSKGSAKAKKHGTSSAHLDDKVKGKAKYDRFGGKGKMKKHANVKDDFDKKCDGRDKNLGTTD